MAPPRTKFAVIGAEDGPDGPAVPGDPLEEALLLAERARTPRERLRAYEQVRAATKMRLRGSDPDAADRELLNANLTDAMEAYKTAPDFETAARALSGWREAIVQRLEATREAEIETEYVLCYSDGSPIEGPMVGDGVMRVRGSAADYWRGVPRKYRDASRFRVWRAINLSFDEHGGSEELRVYEGDALVWAGDR
jgi:hypothetical protein